MYYATEETLDYS